MNPSFAVATGRVLRAARRRRGLTLQDVERRSGGRFKPSALGGYERGERKVPLEVFYDLAALYGAAPDDLVAELSAELEPARRKIVVDLDRLTMLDEAEGRMVGELVHRVKTERGDFVSGVISLRSADVHALSASAGVAPAVLLKRLRPALAEGPR